MLKKTEETEWVWEPIAKLKNNPKNRNKHSKEQIEKISKILQYQGWRSPIVVSNRSNLIVCGHGRLKAAKLLKLTEVPVQYQDFDSEEQEYAHMIADNAIQQWSMLDLSAIQVTDLPNLSPFDIDLMGIRNFQFEPNVDTHEVSRSGADLIECPHCGEKIEKNKKA